MTTNPQVGPQVGPARGPFTLQLPGNYVVYAPLSSNGQYPNPHPPSHLLPRGEIRKPEDNFPQIPPPHLHNISALYSACPSILRAQHFLRFWGLRTPLHSYEILRMPKSFYLHGLYV